MDQGKRKRDSLRELVPLAVVLACLGGGSYLLYLAANSGDYSRGSGQAGGIAVGNQGGACYGNNTCNADLICTNGVCTAEAAAKGEACRRLWDGDVPENLFEGYDEKFWGNGWTYAHSAGFSIARADTGRTPEEACKKKVTSIQIRQTRRSGRASPSRTVFGQCVQGVLYYQDVCKD